jgi:hypothetical protein
MRRARNEHLQEGYERSLRKRLKSETTKRLGAGIVKVVHGDHKLSQALPRKFVRRLHLSRLSRLIHRWRVHREGASTGGER